MADNKLTWLDATATAEMVASGEVKASEVTEAAIARIDSVNDQLNAVICPLYERARQRIETGLPDGPFTGVPIVAKDYDGALGGAPYHCGMVALKEAGHVAPRSDINIARLEAAGFVVVGKTNTPELGLLPTTESEAYGSARNPWDTSRSTGGSSGGTAAAVASGMVPDSTAGDGGGSIRIPASECGLVGLKPSRGRVPMGPDHSEEWGGLVVRGAETRTVRDAAAVLDVLGAPDHSGPYQAPPLRRPLIDEVGAEPGRLRIRVLTAAPGDTTTTDPAIAEVVEAFGRLLESQGHDVAEGSPTGIDDPELVGQFFPAFGSWTAAAVEEKGRWIGRPLTAHDVEPATWTLVEMGRATTAQQYLAAIDWMHGWAARMLSDWRRSPEGDDAGFDLLLTPTLPEVPPLLGQFQPQPDNPLAGSMRAAALVPFMVPFNISGQPAISLPAGSVQGLPVGAQLVAAPGREDLLVRVAAQIEAEHPWAGHQPGVHA